MDMMDYDVITIGGGPGGAAASTLLAQRGHRVLLLERSRTPRFKIGESLMPATYWTLERMGVLPRMKASYFPKKYSVQFFNKLGKASAPFYFTETDPSESSQTWQVLRSEFDALLLDNAREHGVEVQRGALVKEVLFDGERAVGVRAELHGEEEREIRCRVVVDASGQSAVIARKLGLRRPDPELKKAAYFTHYQGALRDPGIDEGATLVIRTQEARSWFWYIPLPDDRVSVGVVGSLDYLITGRPADPQQVFEEELDRCPALQPRLAGATQVFPVQATRDFSYRSSRIAGDGWVLVGDAFGFLDPIYSSGVLLALKSGELAADSIDAALAAGDLSGARLGAHGPRFAAGMEAMRKLVYAFYEQDFSFAKFLARHPEHRLNIIHLLVGNVDHPTEGLFDAMSWMVRFPEEAPLLPADEPAMLPGAGR
ncbi:MAG TPA: NAD(P)/FAD-dependent oxidoreductase [Thermoanaerobaculia bacterium]|jgi:flavin-dependent dehydrogenase